MYQPARRLKTLLLEEIRGRLPSGGGHVFAGEMAQSDHARMTQGVLKGLIELLFSTELLPFLMAEQSAEPLLLVF